MLPKFLVCYSRIGDGCCEPVQRYISSHFFDAGTIDVAIQVARSFRRQLKDSFTYSVTLVCRKEVTVRFALSKLKSKNLICLKNRTFKKGNRIPWTING